MSEAALSRIANLIKVEDDLAKIDDLRQQFAKERASVDTQLNKTTQQQIDSVVANLDKLKLAASKIDSIKDNLERINSLHEESLIGSDDYATFQNSVHLYESMMQVQNLYTDIANFKQYSEHIGNMIEAEYEAVSQNIEYPLFNIHRVHYNVTQARNFQEYLESQSSTLSDDVQSLVRKITSPLKKVVRSFDELLKEVIITVTEAVKEGNVGMVAKLVRIIEYEAAEDRRVVLVDSLGLVSPADKQVANYASFRAGPRHYKKFFYDKLEESLADTFSKCVEHFSQDHMEVYDNLEWLEDELVFVEQTLAPLFPQSWDVSGFIHNAYYKLLHAFTMDIIHKSPPAEDMMRILAYDSHFSTFVASVYGTDKSLAVHRSILGDELKETVLDDYMKVILSKMEEWNQVLMKQEAEAFVGRAEAPQVYAHREKREEIDEFDHPYPTEVSTDVYVLPDFKITLSMLKEQADVAADSGYGKVLVGVIEHWSVCYLKRVSAYDSLVKEELAKYMDVYNNDGCLIKESKAKRLFKFQSSKPRTAYDLENMTAEQLDEISRPGIFEYLTALGNTYEINTDRIQDKFLPSYKSKVHAAYQERIQAAFEQTQEPSLALQRSVARGMAEIIINDLLPALSTVFTSKWYDSERAQSEQNSAQMIVETVVEYMEELRTSATYEIYTFTFEQLLNMLLENYIRIGYQNILHGDGKRIDPRPTKKYKSFSEAISRDVQIIYQGLEGLFSRKDALYLLKSLSALEFLENIAMCEEPVEDVPIMWERDVLETYYNCSVEFVRGALLCRKDIDSKSVGPLITSLQEIKTRYHQTVPPPEMVVATLDNFTY